MQRILWIGANTELLAALQTAEELRAAQIVAVPSEAEAFQQLRNRSFEVVLTDPASPACRDLAYLNLLGGTQPGLKIILLLPEAASADVIAALQSHIFACFTAPFQTTEVIALTARALTVGDWRDGIEVISASPEWISLRVACRRLTAARLVQFVTELMQDMPDADRENLVTAFREILLNAMEHGAGFDPEKVVEVSAIRTHDQMMFYFRDPGPGFRQRALPHAAFSNPPEDPTAHILYRMEQGLRPGGFGILMTRQLVDELIYNESGNEVLLLKRMAKL
jgi:anti-sigma regulatory factor (Ser/Thr protein kinase)